MKLVIKWYGEIAEVFTHAGGGRAFDARFWGRNSRRWVSMDCKWLNKWQRLKKKNGCSKVQILQLCSLFSPLTKYQASRPKRKRVTAKWKYKDGLTRTDEVDVLLKWMTLKIESVRHQLQEGLCLVCWKPLDVFFVVEGERVRFTVRSQLPWPRTPTMYSFKCLFGHFCQILKKLLQHILVIHGRSAYNPHRRITLLFGGGG